ncbi:MAG: GGDEF domain-containing protein [Thermodesulfobacteriota bacterium]
MDKKYNMFLYSLLSKYKIFDSFVSKILLMTVLSALLAIIPIFVVLTYYNLDIRQIIVLCLLIMSFFIIGMVLISILMNSLLSPVYLVCKSLKEYVKDRRKPDMPKNFKDEFGVLMCEVQEFIETVDSKVNSLTKNLMLDHLTGVYNRLSSEKRLSEDIARVKRSKEILTVAMFDIDDFKLFNDYYGHNFGDKCLIQVVETVKNNLRESDWISRWGGDEFLVVFSNVDSNTSKSVLLRIMDILRETYINAKEDKPINVSISVGISELADKDDYISIVKRVDMALIEAKKEGKSKVVVDNLKPRVISSSITVMKN